MPHLILHGESAGKMAGARPRYTEVSKKASREGSLGEAGGQVGKFTPVRRTGTNLRPEESPQLAINISAKPIINKLYNGNGNGDFPQRLVHSMEGRGEAISGISNAYGGDGPDDNTRKLPKVSLPSVMANSAAQR